MTDAPSPRVTIADRPHDLATRRRQEALLCWYDGRAQPLPWRGTADPFAVLVSEVMLQQTQVDRVVPRFERFMARFPTVAALAAAAPGEVIDEWQGLGHNRRAVALQRAAATVVERHGGELPADAAQLVRLPGVGPYTVRALLAFGFGLPESPVDVNIARVLARAVIGRPLTRADAQREADAQLEAGLPAATRPADWSQALMDLGRVHCRARRPRCAGCPLVDACRWAETADEDPAASSAVRSRPQTAFSGSDRQFRGRLLDALRRGPLVASHAAVVIGLADEPDRAARLVGALVADGLAERDGRRLRLPQRALP